MTFSEIESTFISNLQTRLSLDMIEISKQKRFRFNSDEFFQVREIQTVIDYFANSRYDFVDEDFNESHMLKCNYTEAKLLRLIDFFKARYKLSTLPFIDYPKRTINVLCDLLCSNGTELPAGGGVDFFLTKNSTGQLVWRRLPTFIYKKSFVYTSGPQEFELNIIPNNIVQVFVNGQLIDGQDVELDGSTVTILSPNVLESGWEVVIFASFEAVSFGDLGVGFARVGNAAGTEQFDSSISDLLRFEGTNGIDISFDSGVQKVTISSTTLIESLLFEDEFTAATTGTTFTLSDIAKAIVFLFINGQKVKSTDFTHTTGTDSVTVTDTIEVGDEVDIVYTKPAS